MTRSAARSGFETLIDDLASTAVREFDVAAALRGAGPGPGSRVVDKLVGESRTVRRKVVRPELREYKRDVTRQFEVLLEYAESDADFDSYADDVLERDRYVRALRSDLPADRREEIRRWVLDRRRGLAEAVEPIVAAPEEEFWPAVESAFDREAARDLVETHFRLAEPFRQYPRAFAFETDVDPGDLLGGLLASRLPAITVEYTDEAARALQHAERQVIEETTAEIDRRLGDG